MLSPSYMWGLKLLGRQTKTQWRDGLLFLDKLISCRAGREPGRPCQSL